MASTTTGDGQGGTLEQLFRRWLQMTYAGEKQIARRLPDLIGQVGAGPLQQGMLIHLDRTKDQIVRLEEVFDHIGEEAVEGDTAAIDAILAEAEEVVAGTGDDEAGEAALTAVAKTIAAHEIARYRALLAWSKELGREACTALLEQSLAEEKSADEMLSNAADERKNRSA